MSAVIISGDTSGAVTLNAPAIAGTTTLTLPGSSGPLSLMQLETAKTATGTSIDFTSIPSWVKKITVMFQGVSTVASGTTSGTIIQIGTGGTPTTSGYATFSIGGQNVLNARQITNGFYATANQTAAAGVNSGHVVLTNITGNAWVASGIVVDTTSAANGQYTVSAGSISLGGVLNMLRITTQGGTDTFDAGTVNVLYEGY